MKEENSAQKESEGQRGIWESQWRAHSHDAYKVFLVCCVSGLLAFGGRYMDVEEICAYHNMKVWLLYCLYSLGFDISVRLALKFSSGL